MAQATLQLYGRLERTYTERAVAYNAWVRSPAKLNLKVKLPRTAATAPSALADIVSR